MLTDRYMNGYDYIVGPYLQKKIEPYGGFMPPPEYSGDMRADANWHPQAPEGANETEQELYEYNTEQYCVRSSRLAARFNRHLIHVAFWQKRPLSP